MSLYKSEKKTPALHIHRKVFITIIIVAVFLLPFYAIL